MKIIYLVSLLINLPFVPLHDPTDHDTPPGYDAVAPGQRELHPQLHLINKDPPAVFSYPPCPTMSTLTESEAIEFMKQLKDNHEAKRAKRRI